MPRCRAAVIFLPRSAPYRKRGVSCAKKARDVFLSRSHMQALGPPAGQRRCLRIDFQPNILHDAFVQSLGQSWLLLKIERPQMRSIAPLRRTLTKNLPPKFGHIPSSFIYATTAYQRPPQLARVSPHGESHNELSVLERSRLAFSSLTRPIFPQLVAR